MKAVLQKVSWPRRTRSPSRKRQRRSQEPPETCRSRKQEARRLRRRIRRNDRSTVRTIDVSKFKHQVKNFKAGAVSRCIQKWRTITSDPWLLGLIAGYKIEFREDPY